MPSASPAHQTQTAQQWIAMKARAPSVMAAHVTVTMSTNATMPTNARVLTMRRHLVTTIIAIVTRRNPINVTLQGNLSFFFLYRYIDKPYLILGQYDSQSVYWLCFDDMSSNDILEQSAAIRCTICFYINAYILTL